MDHHLIIQLLQEKEAHLLSELEHVRTSLNALMKDHTVAISPVNYSYDLMEQLVPASYAACTTYNNKILFILKREARPMMVDEVVATIITAEPSLNVRKLHNTIGYCLSMLAREHRIKKHPFNRHIKYAL